MLPRDIAYLREQRVDLALWRVGVRKNRWRILIGVGAWSLWTSRCSWSFGEIPDFNLHVVLAKLQLLTWQRAQINYRRERIYRPPPP